MLHLPFPARDAATDAGAAPFGALPEWDLSDLYAAPDAPAFGRDMD